ncbi:FadR/GntR family transcriptional regulator [Fusibacter ferrireducens]|uniref:FadR family transcriptional regulator n=1 Tax=Fusibacter ferrireducens TaxID=2785058 RepID=A0ABR9ZTV6_9FIRM|nr:GntR family transcriptional regulator [Fusibacter ferrireducens]MBF4693910.1 FadR family transcriptional regulator [Fusibacter ferrireducens]
MTVESQFLKQMARHIVSGTWQTGEKLPPERELVKQFGCSRQTVHNGLIKLSNLGLVTIIPRQGVTVNDYMNTGDFKLLDVLIDFDREELSTELKVNMIHFMMLQIELICKTASHFPFNESLDKRVQEMSHMNSMIDSPIHTKQYAPALNPYNLDRDNMKQMLCDSFFNYFHTLCQSTNNVLFLLLINSFEMGIKNAAAYLFLTPDRAIETILLLSNFNEVFQSGSLDFTSCISTLSSLLEKYWLKGGSNA